MNSGQCPEWFHIRDGILNSVVQCAKWNCFKWIKKGIQCELSFSDLKIWYIKKVYKGQIRTNLPLRMPALRQCYCLRYQLCYLCAVLIWPMSCLRTLPSELNPLFSSFSKADKALVQEEKKIIGKNTMWHGYINIIQFRVFCLKFVHLFKIFDEA